MVRSGRFRLQVGILGLGLVLAGGLPAAVGANEVFIGVGQDIQSVVNANPAGTTYRLEAGIHRLQSIQPKSGDTFIGDYGATLRGSKVLDPAQAQQAGSLFYWDGQSHRTASPITWGEIAQEGHEREVFFGNELFLDGQRYRHVNEFSQVNQPGTWYFDYDNDRIYMYGNPAGRTVETSVSTRAFDLGNTEGVTIENLYIQQYANRARPEQGALHTADSVGATFRHVELSYNHAGGLQVGRNMTVENSRFAYNGQIGVSGSASSTPVYFRNNEVAYNMQLGYNPGWEGGATKFVRSVNGVYENNWIHNNNGFAFWWDIGNEGDIIRSNLVEGDTQSRGIFYEISGNPDNPTQIYWNIVRNTDDSGIHISNSTAVEIFENAVWGSPSAIVASENNRSPHLNLLEIRDNELAGIFSQIRLFGSVGDGFRVEEIDGNRYLFGANDFWWFGDRHGSSIDFQQWVAHGNDLNGVFLASGDLPQLPGHATPFTFSHYGPIPEPTSLGLLGAGGLFLMMRRQRGRCLERLRAGG